MPFFTEASFIDFLDQFRNQSRDNWEFYLKTDEFSIYRQPVLDKGLYRYRSIGIWDDIRPDTLAKVYLDLDYRKQWDKNMESYTLFDFEDEIATHFHMKYPWPLAHRDYTYIIENRIVIRDDKEYQVILGQSLPLDCYPEQKNVIRIDSYEQHICITSHYNGCCVLMDYFEDPKGNIPKSVVNWAAKTGVPTFMNNLKNACQQSEKASFPL
ncbi:uncharacterized protein B0P05DRAFT_586920 [Gilbertella persicaria]|uniref:uncharacterized protein n=1 Tax=Gilbertella persicaria TaxID=101096 RepID=UPI002220B72D|nr:uncharacterized protein B0P05DRAFT_586920 [Gilbertella persicaria]KAI8080285.1 hypothetical protein B0P05DRAFT_586920 [Gilbertella persicaria]